MLRIFDRFEYDVSEVIGIGGMGTVYRGVDTTSDNNAVAIKYLKPDIVRENPQMVTRFRREGEALRDLNHPNIVKMLEAGMCEQDHYLVMEYVPGGSLRDLLTRQPQLTLQRVLYIALDLADALTRAHRLDILHRDIKPGNVLLAEDGTPRLTDFGVARTAASEMTGDGQLIGTMAYISPEALTGGVIDARHDIWAFGVMMFEMLAGHRPFQSEHAGRLIAEITTQPIPDLEKIRPDIPVSLVDLVYRMLDRNLDNRINSVRQVGAELERIIHSGGGDTPVGLIIPKAEARFRTTTTANQVVNVETPATLPDTDAPIGVVNIPAQTTPFVGRTREVSEVVNLLRTDGTRLVSLIGPGGTGKTRIAIAVAEQLVRDYPDGVYFVPLASVERPDMVPMKIAEAIDFQFSGSADPMEEMLAFVRDKRSLVVLDNMEHVIEGVEQLSRNLENAPGLNILATTRERLRLRGETVYEVDSMIVPPSNVTTPEKLLEYPSAQLFMSSAGRVAPNFELTPETTPDVARIIALVQGMPLGIELAAGWLEALPVQEIAQEIESSLDFLESDLRDLPERHRSIRAVFEYSWNLMTEPERDLFMKLSVFRGGFDRAAAQKILGTSLRTLTALVNKSLLIRQPNGRFRVAKLLRQYAQEQFEERCTEQQAVYAAYVDYYTTFVDQIGNAFGTKADMQALDAIDDEIENVRHTLQLAIDHMMLPQIERLAIPFSQYQLARSMLVESITHLTELSDALVKAGHGESYTYYLTQALLSTVQGRRGDYIDAERTAQKVLTYVRREENPFGIAYTLNSLAYAQMMLGEYDESRANSKEAVEIAPHLGDKEDLIRGNALGNLGYLEFLAGNLNEAKRIYEEMVQNQYTLENSPIGYAFANNNLGEITQAMGDYTQARTLYQVAYDTFKSFRHKRGMAFTSNNLAGVMTIQGRYEDAEELYQKAYRLNKEIGDRGGIGHSLSAMANMALYKRDFETALDCFTQAMNLRRELGDRLNYGRNLAEVGMMLYMMNRMDEARPYYEEAEKLADHLNNPMLRSLAYMGVGGIRLFDGDYDEAMRYLREAMSLAAETDFGGMGTMFVIAATAMILAERGMNEKAAQLIGFLEEHHGDEGESGAITRPILDNLRYALNNQMGAGFKQSLMVGHTMQLDEVMDTVLTA
jgi:serine/threonine protein kinase/predicted ATPase/Flp pilus assembly protein TadD